MGHVNIEDLIKDLAINGVVPAADDQRAALAFAVACRRADEDPREKQRLRDITDLIEAEDAVYDQALAALNRGDPGAAEPLLRSSAEAGIGDAAWQLACVLENRGAVREALVWYKRAAYDGDPRADEKIAALNASPEPGSEDEPAGSSWKGREDTLRAAAQSAIIAGEISAARVQLDEQRNVPDPSELLAATWRADTHLADTWLSAHLKDTQALALCRTLLVRYALRPSDLTYFTALLHETESHPVLSVTRPDSRVLLAELSRYDRAVNREIRLRIRVAAELSGVTTGSGKTESALTILRALAAKGSYWSWGRAAAVAQVGTAHGQAAADAMIPLSQIPSCTPDTTVHEALEQMLRARAKALPVRDGPGVSGVITLADLAGRIYQARGLPTIQRVETLMQPPTKVAAGTPVTIAMAAAVSSQSGLLIVIDDDGTAIGCLTPETLLALTSGTQPSRHSNETAAPRLVRPGSGELLQVIGETAVACR